MYRTSSLWEDPRTWIVGIALIVGLLVGIEYCFSTLVDEANYPGVVLWTYTDEHEHKHEEKKTDAQGNPTGEVEVTYTYTYTCDVRVRYDDTRAEVDDVEHTFDDATSSACSPSDYYKGQQVIVRFEWRASFFFRGNIIKWGPFLKK